MADRRVPLAMTLIVLIVVGATVVTILRLSSLREHAAWQPPPRSGAVPPPPLGGPLPAAGAAGAPRVLRVDSSGCAPVEEQGFSASMTLDSVAHAGGIPLDYLIRGLHLPADSPPGATLGTLMREHRFSLADVRRVVEDYLKHCE